MQGKKIFSSLKDLIGKISLKYRIALAVICLGVIGVAVYFLVSHFGAGSLALGSNGNNPNVKRATEIVYLSVNSEQAGGNLWRITLDGKTKVQLTNTQGKIIDFAVSRDGNELAYSEDNDQGGDDLWVMNRDGNGAKLLVDCGGDQCTGASWSKDDTQIAYSRLEKGTDAAALQGLSRVWLVDVAGGQTVLLYQDQTILGQDPSWSPDGEKIASYDTSTQNIRVLNLQTKKEVLLPTKLGLVGCWSPDSQKMIFNDIQFIDENSTVLVYIADLNADTLTSFLGQDKSGMDYSIADWSPDGAWIAIGAGNTNGGAGKQILVLTPDESESKLVTNDLTNTYSSYHWDPTSKELLYQEFDLGQSTQGPQILVWDLTTGVSQVVAMNAALPEWLP